MPEIIDVRDININHEQTVAVALGENGFLRFRVTPSLLDEVRFAPKFKGESSGHSHFFGAPVGCELKDLPAVMQDLVIRPPKDIREVIALGKVIDEQKCDFAIYAPEITGEPRKFLKITRWPGWTGLGLMVSGFDPDDKNLWDLKFIGFSDQ